MPVFSRDHIELPACTTTLPYTSIASGRSRVIAQIRLDRTAHGAVIREDFEVAVANYSSEALDDAFVYVVFQSTPGFLLDLEKFDKSNGEIRLASFKEIGNSEDETQIVYEATVYLSRRAVAKFLRKIEEYQEGLTKAGNPKHQTLIANLEQVRAATIRSFWQEPELEFPHEGECWWEIWVMRDPVKTSELQLAELFETLSLAEVEIGRRQLVFPEHLVFLARASARQLGSSILYTDSLAELRKPRDPTDFFTTMDVEEEVDWIADLSARVDSKVDQSTIAVCLLDTGVNIHHPLLASLIPVTNLDAIEPGWSRLDTHPQGHGTPMAGLAIFGDLTDVMAGNNRLSICHHTESVKIIEHSQANDPALYGAITKEAVARAEILNPGFKRIVCMPISTAETIHKGRPSSWSAAVDQIVFGTPEEPNQNTLLMVAAGNLPLIDRINYPLANDSSTVQDPAQSFNAITVGGYTLKDSINNERFPDAVLLAQRGDMGPCSTTSRTWGQEWPRKPDIVMESGNHGIFNGSLIDPESLQLLSLNRGGAGRSWLTAFGDTSAATALASQFAARLYFGYPQLWPETIRGLIIHSADWTPAMLRNRNITQLSGVEVVELVGKVGYGVPNFERARYSANNSLSLIMERVLKPYRIDVGTVKTDEFHIIDLPWPRDVLQQMGNIPVQLKVTLSYYIEPNPGNRQYDLASTYRSYGLRFKMIDSNEGDSAFSARVSRNMREEGYSAEGQERWLLKSQVRDKGSIHKDIWQGSAVELATRSKIAIFPVGGWWKSRKQLMRYDHSVRYSLIVTIETPDVDVDIYTPVAIQIPVQIQV